jgi:hypothetical protein
MYSRMVSADVKFTLLTWLLPATVCEQQVAGDRRRTNHGAPLDFLYNNGGPHDDTTRVRSTTHVYWPALSVTG